MLNLRQLDAEEQSLTSRDLPSGSTIRFNSHTLIGNMGEPLSFGEDSKGHDAPQVTSGDPQKQAPGDVESHLCVDRHPGHDSTDITEVSLLRETCVEKSLLIRDFIQEQRTTR